MVQENTGPAQSDKLITQKQSEAANSANPRQEGEKNKHAHSKYDNWQSTATAGTERVRVR